MNKIALLIILLLWVALTGYKYWYNFSVGFDIEKRYYIVNMIDRSLLKDGDYNIIENINLRNIQEDHLVFARGMEELYFNTFESYKGLRLRASYNLIYKEFEGQRYLLHLYPSLTTYTTSFPITLFPFRTNNDSFEDTTILFHERVNIMTGNEFIDEKDIDILFDLIQNTGRYKIVAAKGFYYRDLFVPEDIHIQSNSVRLRSAIEEYRKEIESLLWEQQTLTSTIISLNRRNDREGVIDLYNKNSLAYQSHRSFEFNRRILETQQKEELEKLILKYINNLGINIQSLE